MIQDVRLTRPSGSLDLTQRPAAKGAALGAGADADQGAVVTLEGSTRRSDDAGYSRPTSRPLPKLDVAPGDAAVQVAAQALPRDKTGRVQLDDLARIAARNHLPDVLARIAAEGLRAPGALAPLVSAVDELFNEYGADTGLGEGALSSIRAAFLADADAPPEVLLARRRDFLTAAGDLGRVLAQRVTEAKNAAPAEADARAGVLGQFVSQLNEAQAQRSTRELRDAARARLQAQTAETPAAPTAADVELGRRFLREIA